MIGTVLNVRSSIDSLLVSLILYSGAALSADRLLRVFLDFKGANMDSDSDVSENDERNQLISLKAQAKTFQMTLPLFIILLWTFSQQITTLIIFIGCLLYIFINLFFWTSYFRKHS